MSSTSQNSWKGYSAAESTFNCIADAISIVTGSTCCGCLSVRQEEIVVFVGIVEKKKWRILILQYSFGPEVVDERIELNTECSQEEGKAYTAPNESSSVPEHQSKTYLTK